ncbi:MAG: type transport system permease protein [Actinomycetota bacterium]|jgi:ABC-2 type transport system permease protein|nr:type transport system permease protein [Actinomycetota bacterium]
MAIARDTWLLLRRSFREGRRDPTIAFVLPTMVPLVMISLTSQIFADVARLPGFPTGRYVTWETPGMVLLTGMMGAGYSATSLVSDFRSGYLDRQRVLPVHPAAIVLGRLLFDVLRVLPAGALVLAVSVVLGGELRGGAGGAAAILGLLALWSLAYSGIFYAVGMRTRNPQAPFALLPIFVPLMFLTTVFASGGMMPGWVQAISAWNPFTYVIGGARVFVSEPFS